MQCRRTLIGVLFVRDVILNVLIVKFILFYFLCMQLEPGVALPSPAQLKRKIIIKNKKKHQHHRTHKNVEKSVSFGATAVAAAIGSASGSLAQSNNVDVVRPRLEKEESKDSVTEEEDAIINGNRKKKIIV